MFLEKLLFGKKYGICIFCNKKILRKNSVSHHDHICICKECNSKINIAPFNHTFLPKVSDNLSFVISPLYYTPTIRQAIHKLKFYSNPKAAIVLGYYINNYLEVFENSEDSLLNDFDFLVPVPLSKERLKQRGYNQAELLALEISRHFNIPVNCGSLIKIKNTRPQSTLPFSKKRDNVKDAYKCNKSFDGKRILLIDDVCTTGSTLNNCAKALKENGALMVAALTASHNNTKTHSTLYNELFS